MAQQSTGGNTTALRDNLHWLRTAHRTTLAGADMAQADVEAWVALINPVPDYEADKGIACYKDVLADGDQARYGYSPYRDDLITQLTQREELFGPNVFGDAKTAEALRAAQALENSLDPVRASHDLLQIGVEKLLDPVNVSLRESFNARAGFRDEQEMQTAVETLEMLVREDRIAPPEPDVLQMIKAGGAQMTGVLARDKAMQFCQSIAGVSSPGDRRLQYGLN